MNICENDLLFALTKYKEATKDLNSDDVETRLLELLSLLGFNFSR